MADQENKSGVKKGTTRRDFLRNSGLTVGGVVLGGALGGLLGGRTEVGNEEVTPAPKPTANPAEALTFFTPPQYQLTQAAAERIYPKDDNGPGAMELNAAIYIDHQLASPWGINSKEYMAGPFYEAEETQGSQIRILRKDLFLLGLKAMDSYSNEQFDSQFTDLAPEDQDAVLTAFSDGTVPDISGVKSPLFFSLLRALTIEGIYADPVYGGNKNMEGWAMRKYPGTRMAYTKEIQKEEFVKLEPQGLNSHMGH